MNVFEKLGFYKEFYINSKFIGTINCDNDREEIGYIGRKTETLTSEIKCDNGKKIKSGTEVMIVIYPLTGKQI